MPQEDKDHTAKPLIIPIEPPGRPPAATTETPDPCYRAWGVKLKAEVLVKNQGSIFLVRPRTQRAKVWLEENAPGQWWDDALVVEHRYIRNLTLGIHKAGFELA